MLHGLDCEIRIPAREELCVPVVLIGRAGALDKALGVVDVGHVHVSCGAAAEAE